MTLHMGRCRIRLSARYVSQGQWWYRRERFPEGIVCRAQGWRLFIKALIDRQSVRERTMAEQRIGHFISDTD